MEVCNSLAEVMFRYTNYVMYLAPFGVGAAMAHDREQGVGVLLNLGKLVADSLRRAGRFSSSPFFGGSRMLFRIPLRRFIALFASPS